MGIEENYLALIYRARKAKDVRAEHEATLLLGKIHARKYDDALKLANNEVDKLKASHKEKALDNLSDENLADIARSANGLGYQVYQLNATRSAWKIGLSSSISAIIISFVLTAAFDFIRNDYGLTNRAEKFQKKVSDDHDAILKNQNKIIENKN